ncbi:LAMI_0D01332g1_1 [Lachancea mirantina]|uniref:LAMI_0D01332g1_1 n=1 Tax=Lachancea mirantina TaxID=1230905 RepID=A0A1G4J9A6_9SACH|nr:LAMI_0D01332g1_1 [Lachancea mirantina]
MSQQQPAEMSYTLPGVMHYLQTEFTRNERDRIAWELERSEMRTRIAQLEGENRSLKYELMLARPGHDVEDGGGAISGPDTIKEPLLLKSRMALQENVKEIVYLLKSRNVTEGLHALNERQDSTHLLEQLNLGSNETASDPNCEQAAAAAATTRYPVGQNSDAGIFDSADGSGFSPIEGPMASFDGAAESSLDSDAETIADGDGQESEEGRIVPPRENVEAKAATTAATRPRASSLFATKRGAPAPNMALRCQRLRYHLAQVENLVVSQFNMLSYARDGLLKHWMIEPNLTCNDKLTKSFHGLAPVVSGLYWLDSQKFLSVDNAGLKVWSVNENDPVTAVDVFAGESCDVVFQDIQSLDFKSSRLVITTSDEIQVWELAISSNELKIVPKHKISASASIADAVLGMTENSLIALYMEPLHLEIYNLKGDTLLANVDLQAEIKIESDLSTPKVGKLYLNKLSSKILIQVGAHIAVYSFDTKSIVLSERLNSSPTGLVFKSPKDYIVLAYNNGTVEVRSTKNFHDTLKRYNHYDDENEYEDESGSQDDKRAQSTNSNLAEEGEELGDLRQSSHTGVIIDVTEIDKIPVIVSGGDDGMIRLERVTESA